MKVLQLLSNPTTGGTETFVVSVSAVLREMGFDVRIANLWPGAQTAALAAEAGIPYGELPGGGRHIRPGGIVALARLLRTERFDIACAYGLRSHLALRLAWPACRGPIMVNGVRGIDAWRRWYHVWPDRLTQGQVACFIGNSRSVCQVRHQREGTPRGRLAYIPNGIDTARFSRQAGPWPGRAQLGLPAGPLCLTVANFRPEKGHGFFLEVLRSSPQLRERAHWLWIGGVDWLRVQRQVERLGWQGRILVREEIKDVRPLYAAADVFVLLSSEEGMPRALMEAMAMGVPCLATAVGGTAEVIRDGQDGLLVEYGDAGGVARRLGGLLDDEGLRRRLGRNAAERIETAFSLRRVAEEHAELFSRLVARRGRPVGGGGAQKPRARVAVVAAVPESMRALLWPQIKAMQSAGYEVHGVCSGGDVGEVERLRTSAREQVARDLRLSFVLEKVAATLSVEVTDEEVNTEIARMAKMYNKRFDRVRDDLQSNGLLDQLAEHIRQDKCIERLLADAQIS